VLNLDLTFDGCVVNDLYGLTIANVVSFGPDFSRTTNNGKFVDDGRVKDWTSPLCLHSVKVILGRRLAALAGRSKQPVVSARTRTHIRFLHKRTALELLTPGNATNDRTLSWLISGCPRPVHTRLD